MRLFLDTKTRLFYTPHIRGPWHQNKWRVCPGMLLKQETLPDVRTISGDFFIFQQDSAWFTVVSRIVTFPDGVFPGKTFPGWSFSRIGRFPERRFPDGHFPGWDNFLWLINRRTPNMNNALYIFTLRREANWLALLTPQGYAKYQMLIFHHSSKTNELRNVQGSIKTASVSTFISWPGLINYRYSVWSL